MKKNLVLAGLLLVSNLIASDNSNQETANDVNITDNVYQEVNSLIESKASNYVTIGYEMATAKFSSLGTLDMKDVVLNYFRKADTYLVNIGVAKLLESTLDTTINGNKATISIDGMGYGVTGVYKFKKDKIFAGPILGYTHSSTTTDINVPAANYSYSKTTTDSDLSLGVMLGYDYTPDSFAYVALNLDTDLLESEDYDSHQITIGIYHAVKENFLLGASYFRDLSNENSGDSFSGFSVEVGMKF